MSLIFSLILISTQAISQLSHHLPGTGVGEVGHRNALPTCPVFNEMANHPSLQEDYISRLHAHAKANVWEINLPTLVIAAKDAEDGPAKDGILTVCVDFGTDIPKDLSSIINKVVQHANRIITWIHLPEPSLEFLGVLVVIWIKGAGEDIDTVTKEGQAFE